MRAHANCQATSLLLQFCKNVNSSSTILYNIFQSLSVAHTCTRVTFVPASQRQRTPCGSDGTRVVRRGLVGSPHARSTARFLFAGSVSALRSLCRWSPAAPVCCGGEWSEDARKQRVEQRHKATSAIQWQRRRQRTQSLGLPAGPVISSSDCEATSRRAAASPPLRVHICTDKWPAVTAARAQIRARMAPPAAAPRRTPSRPLFLLSVPLRSSALPSVLRPLGSLTRLSLSLSFTRHPRTHSQSLRSCRWGG